MKRHMTEKLAEFEKAIAESASAKERTPDADRRMEEMKRHADALRARIAQIDKGETPEPMGPGGPGGPDGPRPMDGRRFEGRRGNQNGPSGPGDRMRGPAPSVEQRLEMLERAVREMHEMFQRHNVPPEARERAEQSMRERRDGGPPPMGEGRRPDGGDRPDEGRAPRPPMPRPGMPKPEMDDAEKAQVKSFIAAKEAEMTARMAQAAQQMEEMKKQLADAQAALKKAHAEIDELRANAKK